MEPINNINQSELDNPTTTDSIYDITHIFDVNDLQKLQDYFSEATGLASIMTKPDGTPITKPSNFCKLCNIIRNTEKGLKNCKFSDAYIGRPKKDGPRIQACMSAGLIDSGASIMVGDIHIGNWMIGQVMDQNKNSKDLLKYANEIGADIDIFKEAINDINRMSIKQVHKISEFLFVNVKLLSDYAVKNVLLNQEIERTKQSEQSLYQEKELFKTTIQSIGDSVITTDNKGIITSLNSAAEKITGWKQEDSIGIHFEKVFTIINEKTKKTCKSPVDKVLKEQHMVYLSNDTAIISKDGIETSINDSAAPIKDKNNNILGVVVVFRDVTEHRKKESKITYLSTHDKLTGLYNRYYFENKVKQFDDDTYLPLSIIMGDVNGLKLTNDIFGHNQGDLLLKTISDILKSACPKNGVLARWGGDEFLLLLPNTNKEKTITILSKIKKICASYSVSDLKIAQISISLGADTKESPEEDINTILKNAENNMYKNKLMETKKFNNTVIESLKHTMIEKNFDTKEYFERVAHFSRVIGQLGLEIDQISDPNFLAILRNIGKTIGKTTDLEDTL